MRDVRDNVDLAQLQAAGRGFILNVRTDRKKLHRAGCEAVGAMYPGAYRKIFFEDLREASGWLNTEYGERGWEPCGKCYPQSGA